MFEEWFKDVLGMLCLGMLRDVLTNVFMIDPRCHGVGITIDGDLRQRTERTDESHCARYPQDAKDATNANDTQDGDIRHCSVAYVVCVIPVGDAYAVSVLIRGTGHQRAPS